MASNGYFMAFEHDFNVDDRDELSYVFIDSINEDALSSSPTSIISIFDTVEFMEGVCNLIHPKSYCNIKKYFIESFLMKKLLDEDSDIKKFETRLTCINRMLDFFKAINIPPYYKVSPSAKAFIDRWVKAANVWLDAHRDKIKKVNASQ